MSWLDKILPSRIQTEGKKQIPDDVWTKCEPCSSTIYAAELLANQNVCPKCDHHMRISARKRLISLFDKSDLIEIAETIKPVDKLKFKDSKNYKDRIKAAQKSTDENDALIAFSGELSGKPLVAAAFEFTYMGGSMGAVVGEKFVRAVEKAIELNAPFVCFAASGGARMQEGLISLMQMSKTSAALTRLSDKKLPFISVLTDPTMGGVSASFAMLGDLIIAEPKALIGFAGPRVIEQTVRETLPEGFQRSEFLLEKGAVDMIVDRRDMRETFTSIFSALLFKDAKIQVPKEPQKMKELTDNESNIENTPEKDEKLDNCVEKIEKFTEKTEKNTEKVAESTKEKNKGNNDKPTNAEDSSEQ